MIARKIRFEDEQIKRTYALVYELHGAKKLAERDAEMVLKAPASAKENLGSR